MICRGSIIEICHDSIVVLTEDCTFERIRKIQGLTEGMEVYYEDGDIIRKSRFYNKNITSVAAAVFIFIMAVLYSVGFWNRNYKTVALLSVDINPSVEIKLNKSYRVIKAIPLNEDALNLPLKNLNNYPLVEALEELVKMAGEEGYIKENDVNYILVTSVELNDSQEDEKVLEQLIVEGKERIEILSRDKGKKVEVLTLESDKKTLDKAKEEHISVGKMEVYEKTKDKDIKDIKNKKVEEIIKDVEKIKGPKTDKGKEEKTENKKDEDVKKEKDDKKEKAEKKEKEDKKDKEDKGNNKDKKEKDKDNKNTKP